MNPRQIFGVVGLKIFGTRLRWNPPKQNCTNENARQFGGLARDDP